MNRINRIKSPRTVDFHFANSLESVGNSQTIIGQFDSGWQPGIRFFVFEVMRHVGQVRPLWPHAINGRQGLGNSKMSRMGFVTKGIDDQDIKPFQQRPAFVRNEADICAKRHISDSKSENGQLAVHQPDWPNWLLQHLELIQTNSAQFKLRDCSIVLIRVRFRKCVRIGGSDLGFDIFFAVKRNGASEPVPEQTQVIQSKEMVCVTMRVNDGMNQIDSFSQQLHAQLGRRVDQKSALQSSDGDSSSRPVVARIGRSADGTMAPNDRDPMTGAGAQQYQFSR